MKRGKEFVSQEATPPNETHQTRFLCSCSYGGKSHRRLHLRCVSNDTVIDDLRKQGALDTFLTTPMSSTRNFASVLQIVNVQTDSRLACERGDGGPKTSSYSAFHVFAQNHARGFREAVQKRRPRSDLGRSPFPHITSLLQKLGCLIAQVNSPLV